MSKALNDRNVILDYFKVVLSIFVIAIHIYPVTNNLYSWLLGNGIARIAVPCFFIINGYYLSNKINNNIDFKRYMKHLILVYFVWAVIYIPIMYIYYHQHYLDKENLYFSVFFGFYHLWYLPALILGSFILKLLVNYIHRELIILLIAIFLFFTGYIIQEQHTAISYLYRNALFIGFPFITIGYFIKKKSVTKTIPSYVLYPITVITLLSLLFESYQSFISRTPQEFYLSLIVLCPTIYLCIQKNAIYRKSKGYFSTLSTAIYFIHIWVLFLLQKYFNLDAMHSKLFIVSLFAALAGSLVIIINKRIKIFL